MNLVKIKRWQEHVMNNCKVDKMDRFLQNTATEMDSRTTTSECMNIHITNTKQQFQNKKVKLSFTELIHSFSIGIFHKISALI